MFPINWNDVFRKKDGTLVNMEDMGGGTSELPEYSEADAGKLLEVSDTGELGWANPPQSGGKLYYKDFSMGTQSSRQLASFSDDAASASGVYVAVPYNAPNFNVTGYRAIHVTAIDTYTGYQCSVTYNVWNDKSLHIAYIFNNRSDNSGVKYRVYYVKETDIEVLT